MQFVSDGPDIPDALLRAHEEGRVVFFCGAGVSYPAGLPGFKGLVEKVYKNTGAEFSDIERDAFNRGQYDATLDLLERRLPGQRVTVRRAMVKALRPKLKVKGALDTHAALLRLSRSRQGALRLVTTNFDRVFHVAAKRTGQVFDAYSAPMLPIPKNSRWNGLVYLHGLLSGASEDTSLHRLVVTSGDFGLAYLTERWAARFVSEMFRNYVICFVGYSINDPVLRYMMDALAADRMQGEVTQQAWALGDCEVGQERQKTVEWEAKGVTPILYSVPPGGADHSALHKTLHVWAETYRDGVQGKEAIVVKHALTRPQSSTVQDNFVGRVLWALSDKSGLPAKRFAEFNPAPSLDWLLESFSVDSFGYGDLRRFNVPPHEAVDEGLEFSLVRRPAPYDFSPLMTLVSGGVADGRWDEVMLHLAKWLVRHLDDPRLVLWVAERGGKLHATWHRLVEQELQRFSSLEIAGRVDELDEIREKAPRAIPRPQMLTLWQILLAGRVKINWNALDFFRWRSRLKMHGLTPIARLEFRELLAPKISIRKPFALDDDYPEGARVVTKVKHLVDFDLELAANHVRSALQDSQDDTLKNILPKLIDDVQLLLRDALDLLRALGEADEFRDRSNWDIPSVEPHWQNRGFHDWVVLIELLRDAWLEVLAESGVRAAHIAQQWFDVPYPTFKRLSLFAASRCENILPSVWVDWLLSDGSWWLWSPEMGREVFRLIVLRGKALDQNESSRLESAILAGPQRSMYRLDMEAEAWQKMVSRSTWLRLAKLEQSGVALGAAASKLLGELSIANSHWVLADNNREEFSHWMSGTGDPDFEDERHVDIAPRTRVELVGWLEQPVPDSDPFYEDTWRDVCRTRFYHSFAALCDLSRNGVWPVSRWRDALNVWADDALVARSWRYSAHLVKEMPSQFVAELSHSFARWLEAASKSIVNHPDVMLELAYHVLEAPHPLGSESSTFDDEVEINRPVSSAINHPFGMVAQALLNLWFARAPSDNDGLPSELRRVFTDLSDGRATGFKHARVILGSQLIAFFRVDRAWTEQHLLPLFDWNGSDEAKRVWQGFLWSPRIYPPLMISLKSQFLNCAKHYDELGEFQQQYSVLLTYAALGPAEGYEVAEFRHALAALPRKGLEEAAQALSQAVEGAASKSEDYWRNRAQPFLQQVWPKSRDLASVRISDSFAKMTIAVGRDFPKALATVVNWLLPIEHPGSVVRSLSKSGLCNRYPSEALELLDAVIDKPFWVPDELVSCMQDIAAAAPYLVQDARFQRIDELVRRSAG
ncbi:TPA: anti-phage defense-associated sirtuin Dsr1 [Stenotrophomonas maltophilia]